MHDRARLRIINPSVTPPSNENPPKDEGDPLTNHPRPHRWGLQLVASRIPAVPNLSIPDLRAGFVRYVNRRANYDSVHTTAFLALPGVSDVDSTRALSRSAHAPA